MEQKPLRLGVAGLSHDHVFGLLRTLPREDIELVGIAEADEQRVEAIRRAFGILPSLFYPSLDEMIAQAHPEAVAAFGSIYEHYDVVKVCAPFHIHVLVEKPLAVNAAHAEDMAALARQYGIHLLTNYETTWYPSMAAAYQQVVEGGQIGPIRKVAVHDGHQGPVELGCTPAFLAWLTDPVLNGGGALVDFGCYGANLITWLMGGAEPLTVTAVTQTLKPDVYPKVDDDSTIILTYAHAQGLIQGSWNWPIGRKDLEIYGAKGQLFAPDGYTLQMHRMGEAETQETHLDRPAQLHDAFSHLAAVVRGQIPDDPHALSGLKNNLTVVRILDAARESARTGKTVRW